MNVRAASLFPWFFIGVGAILFGTMRVAERWRIFVGKNKANFDGRFLVMASSLLCTAVAIAIMIGHGQPIGLRLLPGDEIAASTLFKNAVSIATLFSGGILEEVAVRGPIQQGLQRYFKPVLCEGIADCQFVAFHFLRFSDPGEVLFVALVAVVNGRVTGLSGQVRYAAWSHALTNFAIGLIVLAARNMPGSGASI
jgi:membrane protease YdiL (CAAX protease family)